MQSNSMSVIDKYGHPIRGRKKRSRLSPAEHRSGFFFLFRGRNSFTYPPNFLHKHYLPLLSHFTRRSYDTPVNKNKANLEVTK